MEFKKKLFHHFGLVLVLVLILHKLYQLFKFNFIIINGNIDK